MSIQIKEAKFEDLLEILEIINYEILNSTSIWEYDIRTLEQQQKIFEEKKINNQPFLIAIKENKIVGFGTYGSFRFKIGYQFTAEHSVYVHKDFHGNGIGSLLLKELIKIAKKEKIHTLIGVIDSENLGSLAFHKKLGFQEVGHIKETGFKFNKWLDSIFVQILL
ncbi:N-acetyltransferase [Flavobacterium columnare]|uniref:Phosphinothricin N-acetyltransferase YncA n=2 Tax=Flavobacterium columnare TaxID=996 RepID=G8X648_FLACA|nr:GNAT family N-acetyltransferase [Flavobacterium columnare]AEW86278.1 phosphinothricin N-acetyltransferase YncA [Flavobacterium columnare ATCC 49512]AMO19977.1 N-acetyltransferase family protein [Flavobacterium columnare]ANO48517.1 phosphinothricin N-acetyltransferase YncA [Flavobacterium columnare]APT23429.1 N-acetyltransferase [Flavobacterium columnare]AUX17918.1 phosphinothricin acetyltransferase [Flavobacterium columnare]